MAPLLVERLIGGQVYQTFYSIQMPASFVGLKFIDLFRAFMSRNVGWVNNEGALVLWMCWHLICSVMGLVSSEINELVSTCATIMSLQVLILLCPPSPTAAQAMILAIYRAPTEANEAILPYAVTCPAPDLLLSAEDKVRGWWWPLIVLYFIA